MKNMVFDVTTRVTVRIDEETFTSDRMKEFNRSITDFGTGEFAFIQHGEHIARLVATGLEDFGPNDLIEGYGRVGEAGISVEIDEFHLVEIMPTGAA